MKVTLNDHILMMGSCFSTEIGTRLIADGYDVCLNPFGILFNPASIASSIERLESGLPFTAEDVIRRTDDASKGLYSYVSFHHHGAFARRTADDFLINANVSLKVAYACFSETDVVILTFGTAWVFRHLQRNIIVSNCHKVPAKEFSREFMSCDQIKAFLRPIFERHPDKRWILTVSPVKHLADGEDGNHRSKETLVKAAQDLSALDNVEYFPSYEMVISNPANYKDDRSHPTEAAIEKIYSAFVKLNSSSKD